MGHANKLIRRQSSAVRYCFFSAADCPYILAIGAFILTVGNARIISLCREHAHWELPDGLHVHHYVFGIFILAFAGYVALVLKGPRATFFIALLYGFGLGLTFDEFGIWLRGLNPAHRWSETGLLIVAAAFLFGSACVYTYKRSSVRSGHTGGISHISSENEAGASAE